MFILFYEHIHAILSPIGMQNSEYNLLIECLKNSLFVERLGPLHLKKPIDWHFFLDLASTHRVIPLVYQQAGYLQHLEIPPHAMHDLHARYLKQKHRSLTLISSLIELAQKLKKESIPFMVLKGIPLSCQLYGDPCTRTPNDIDIWVHPRHLVSAYAVCQELPYQRYLPHSPIRPEQWPYLIHAKKDFSFTHITQKHILELHHRLADAENIFPLRFEQAYQQSQIISLSGEKFHILSQYDEFIYLCYHASRSMWTRLQWACDIAKWLTIHEPTTDWTFVYNRAAKLRSSEYIQEMLLVLKQLFQLNINSISTKYFKSSKSIYIKSSEGIKNTQINSPYTISIENIFHEKIGMLLLLFGKNACSYWSLLAQTHMVDSFLWRYLPARCLRKEIAFLALPVKYIYLILNHLYKNIYFILNKIRATLPSKGFKLFPAGK